MTREEVLAYIEEEKIPERFDEYRNSLFEYAITANCYTYMLHNEMAKREQDKWTEPANVKKVSELVELLVSRGVFVDLLTKKEVYDMAIADFSRDEIIRYSAYEDGVEEGKEEERETGLKGLIESCKYFKASFIDAIERVVAVYGMDYDEAEKRVAQYW